MQNPIKLIYKFNEQAGLLNKGYDDFLESSFQVEEALEGFDPAAGSEELYNYFKSHPEAFSSYTHKELARDIVGQIRTGSGNKPLSDVDRLDKACDAVVFAVGSMAKLGLNPNLITEALNIVMQANLAKLNMPKDEYGKLTKSSDFVGPEAKLQELLDRR